MAATLVVPTVPPTNFSNVGGTKATYTYAISDTATYATPTDWIVLTGSATKLVRVVRMEFSGRATASTSKIAVIKKHTVANTGGTATNPTPAQHDSADAAASATVSLYSVAPTIDSSAITLYNLRVILALGPQATQTAGQDRWLYDAGVTPGEPITLRGIAQELAINLAGAAVTTGEQLEFSITWTEE